MLRIIESKVIMETSFSRLVSKIILHDTGTITAFRSEYTRKENMQRNQSLLANLTAKGYRMTPVKGIFVENYDTELAVEVEENVFFVEDYKDKGNLKQDLIYLGELFQQDSVMFIPKASNEIVKNGTASSVLIGTSHTNNFPKYHIEVNFPIVKFGSDKNEFLTRVNGRPMFFTEAVDKDLYAGTNNGRWIASLESKKDWRTLVIEERD